MTINTSAMQQPFVTAAGTLVTPTELLTALLGDTNGNPASKTFVCKAYLNGKPVSSINGFRITNVMIAGGKSTFSYLNLVLRVALETKELPSLPLNYSITGMHIHNFPVKEATESGNAVTITLPEDVALLMEGLRTTKREPNPENIGNINVVRVTGSGTNINMGFIANDERNALAIKGTTALLRVLPTLTWHLEFTNAAKEWFNIVTA